MTASTPTPALPSWRQALTAVPVDRRCASQAELARAVEVVDAMKATLSAPLPNVHSPAAAAALLAPFLEVAHTRIKDRSWLGLLPPDALRQVDGYVRTLWDERWDLEAPENEGDDLRRAIQLLAMAQYIATRQLESDIVSAETMLAAAGAVEAAEAALGGVGDADAALAALGARTLTKTALLEMCVVDRAVFLLKAVEAGAGEDTRAAAAAAAEATFDLMEASCSWYAWSELYDLVRLAVDVLDKGHGVVERRALAIGRRYLAVALEAQPPDPLRESWVRQDLALMTTNPSGWRYSELEEHLLRAPAAAAAARPWMPPYYRALLTSGMDIIETFAVAAQKARPDDYRTATLTMEVLSALGDGDATAELTEGGQPVFHACGACCTRGIGLQACAAVSSQGSEERR